MRPSTQWLPLLLLLLLCGTPAVAWHVEGHRQIAADAVRVLPGEVPEFFRQAAAAVGHSAEDPDIAKSPDTPALRSSESPEHYIDWELLELRPLPSDRMQYLQTLAAAGVEAGDVGSLPYAVVEGTERLAVDFAEYRCWPDNPFIRAKTLVDGGRLAHYGADLVQPLHTTVDHDGRANPDGSSPHTGIHARVDGLLEQEGWNRENVLDGARTDSFPDLWAAVAARLADSHNRVDVLYAMPELTEGAQLDWTPRLSGLARDRYRASVSFVSSLLLTAWERSAAVELPDWHRREGPAGDLVPCRVHSPAQAGGER